MKSSNYNLYIGFLISEEKKIKLENSIPIEEIFDKQILLDTHHIGFSIILKKENSHFQKQITKYLIGSLPEMIVQNELIDHINETFKAKNDDEPLFYRVQNFKSLEKEYFQIINTFRDDEYYQNFQQKEMKKYSKELSSQKKKNL